MMFVNDMAGQNFNMGSPFVVLDVWEDDDSNFCIDTTLAALPVGSSTESTVTITLASPGVVTWASHGLIAGAPIIFMTTGALSTGMNASTLYYVLAAGLATNTFEFSTSAGGAAVNTSVSQSGTQTCVANPLHFEPHPCPRITASGLTGCAQAADLNGAVDEPLFSRAHRMYVGNIYLSGNQGYMPSMYLWGNLVSLTVNVIKAYTGALGTLTMGIAANAFAANLTPDNLSQTINLLLAGERVITPGGTTGAQSGDSLTATGTWLSGPVKVTYSADTNEALNLLPIVEVTIQTDQGITKFNIREYGGGLGLAETHAGLGVDSGVVSYFTT
jgi:hypothetical protein